MAAATTDKLEAKSDMGCGKKDADKKDMMSVKRYSSKKAKMKPEEEEMREGEADKGDGYKNKMVTQLTTTIKVKRVYSVKCLKGF